MLKDVARDILNILREAKGLPLGHISTYKDGSQRIKTKDGWVPYKGKDVPATPAAKSVPVTQPSLDDLKKTVAVLQKAVDATKIKGIPDRPAVLDPKNAPSYIDDPEFPKEGPLGEYEITVLKLLDNKKLSDRKKAEYLDLTGTQARNLFWGIRSKLNPKPGEHMSDAAFRQGYDIKPRNKNTRRDPATPDLELN